MVDFFSEVIAGLKAANHIRVCVVFGSFARFLHGFGDQPDRYSDVDVQVITDDLSIFRDESWPKTLSSSPLLSYTHKAVFGGVNKATVIFDGGGVDVVILDHRSLLAARFLHSSGFSSISGKFRARMASFSDLMRFDYCMVKGSRKWEEFYREAGLAGSRLEITDSEAQSLSCAAFAEAINILGRIERGELIAAQRLLHLELVELNIRLLNELRERRGEYTYHRGRRAEQILPDDLRKYILVDSRCNKIELTHSTLDTMRSNRALIKEITGTLPIWNEDYLLRYACIQKLL